MFNTNDENEKEDGLNLSDMINEYEEDSVLRDKIESLKAEKAQEEAQRLATDTKRQEETAQHTALPLDATMDLPRYGSATFDTTFLDDEQTQVEETDEELDGDKTLVIMDNQTKRDFDDNESILYYGDHEVDAEEITEEDIQEFLGDEVKKQRKPMDPKKMNKIVTYVISGIVGLCILFGAGFGIKMAMDAFADNEPAVEPEEKDPVEKDPAEKDPVEIPDKPNTDKPNENPSEGSQNAVKIAGINGTIKAKQQQVTDLHTAVENAKSDIERLTKEAQELNDKYAAKNAEYGNISNKVTEAKGVLTRAEADLAAGKEGAQETVNTAKATLDSINAGLEAAKTERDNAKNAYDSKESEKSKKVSDKDGYVSQISSIQLEIDNLQKELQTLQ